MLHRARLTTRGVDSNVYHVFTKSETSSKFIEHATATALTGPYTFVQTGDFAGWGRAEGPSITQLPSGQFRLCVCLVFLILARRRRAAR